MAEPPGPTLIAVQPIYRSGGSGQVSLYRGDVFRLPAEQWLLSAFQDVVSPSGGAWKAFWSAAARRGQAWPEDEPPALEGMDPDRQTALLHVNPGKREGLPSLVLFGRMSRRQRQVADGEESWVEAVYFDVLRVCRQLAREGRFGTRIAMPVLFGAIHGVAYHHAISLQRAFAEDLIRQEPRLSEVMISVLQDGQAEKLLEAWHLASGDTLAISREALSTWLKDSLNQRMAEVRARLVHMGDGDLTGAIQPLLQRLDEDLLYLNDLAVMARSVVESWASRRSREHGIQPGTSLAGMVSHLRGRSGTPNRSLLYIDAIRELGNVGAHFQTAPHPLEPEDLLTILQGLMAMLRVEGELRH